VAKIKWGHDDINKAILEAMKPTASDRGFSPRAPSVSGLQAGTSAQGQEALAKLLNAVKAKQTPGQGVTK